MRQASRRSEHRPVGRPAGARGRSHRAGRSGRTPDPARLAPCAADHRSDRSPGSGGGGLGGLGGLLRPRCGPPSSARSGGADRAPAELPNARLAGHPDRRRHDGRGLRCLCGGGTSAATAAEPPAPARLSARRLVPAPVVRPSAPARRRSRLRPAGGATPIGVPGGSLSPTPWCYRWSRGTRSGPSPSTSMTTAGSGTPSPRPISAGPWSPEIASPIPT